ncbi:MAG: hypothetical protein HC817_04330 [Saprospiraceae bacterium]|nr:hypothetical protein [Saprospiraceae bacterium]
MKRNLFNDFGKGEEEEWKFPENRRRVKFFVTGKSSPEGTPIFSDCTPYLNCEFVLRTQAQRKNFWGSWVFSNYYPPFSLVEGVWDYVYNTYAPNDRCGFSVETHFNDLGNVGITSPHSRFVPSTNNGFFNLVPHGTWYSPEYFRSAFNVTYRMNANYAGFPYLIERQ